MKSKRFWNFTILLLLANPVVHALPGRFVPVLLKCDYWVDPKGVDHPDPRLSWNIEVSAQRRGMKQTAYEVLVASSVKILANNKGNLWQTGKLQGDQMQQVAYAGKKLASSQSCWWKVRVWDEQGKVSAWSQPSQWTMGILSPAGWSAKWITAVGAEKFAPVIAPQKTDFIDHIRRKIDWQSKIPGPQEPNFNSMFLRRQFTLSHKPARAIIHVSGLGSFELTINGKKVGDHLLAPGWSGYDKTVLYESFDITHMLKTGGNAIGILLSNGLYNIQPDAKRYVKMLNTYGQLKAIAQLHLQYKDGSETIIGTDSSWKVHPGPLTFMNFYGGEDFDARLEPAGWNKAGFNAGAPQWQKALVCSNPAALKGLSASAPPVKVIEQLTPVKVSKIREAVWVYDLGQNTSIMPGISIRGARGASIRIIPAELLGADGLVDRRSVTQDGVRPAWWQYTLGVNGKSDWKAGFFYQGARYLQVELFAAPGDTVLPSLEHLAGLVVHSSATPVGNFSCSNPLFNNIYQLVRWAQRSNMMTVLTDCPHREKMPWLEQYHLNGPSLRYNYDLATLFTKAMSDMADAQLSNGLVPNIAPEFFHAGADWKTNGFRNSPEWGSSLIIVPWQQYLFAGDLGLLQRYYAQMQQYLSFLDSESKDHLLFTGLGDWYDIGPKPSWGSQLTPEPFTASVIYYYDYEIMAKIARRLNKDADAVAYEKKQDLIREAFNVKFFNKEKGIYATGSNTTCAMPLFFNLVEPANRQHLLQALVDSIRNRQNSFTSGEVGYRFLLRSLADNGFSNVVYAMNNQRDRPGYGYQLKLGATSLTEKWDGGVGSFGSQNHFMSGQINEWFFNDLVGIGPDAAGPGFRKMIIRPAIVGDLSWVKGSYQSMSGLVAVEWKKDGKNLLLHISVPANTEATVYVPASSVQNITEGGNSTDKVKSVRFLQMENGYAVFAVASGEYRFASKEFVRF